MSGACAVQRRRWGRAVGGGLIVAAVAVGMAQSTATQPQIPASFSQVIASARPDVPATLTFANREIVVLHASVLNRSSAERVQGARALLNRIVDEGGPMRVAAQQLEGAEFILVNNQNVLAILPADVDELAGETLAGKTSATVTRLQQALDEVAEAESPGLLFRGALYAAGATVLFLLAAWALTRIDRVARQTLTAKTERVASQGVAGAVLRQARFVHYVRRLTDLVLAVVGLLFAYWWLSFVLRRFPYSRPWGDALRGFLLDRFEWLGLGILHALPGLVTVILIAIATRVVSRLSATLFEAIELGRITLPGVYPETATPTRKLVTGLLWIFALIIAYPFLPGSNTDAFKGVSVFLGLVVSLGSTGIVNQVMSGLTVTYARALRVGDYVKVGEIEGTVKHLGTLAMKIETPRREDVTIPNSVIISGQVTNYTRNTSGTDVLAATSVTIGYDTPWRQVHALLLLAAGRTAGIRKSSGPYVFQAGLEDFYVKYLLVIAIEDPRLRAVTLGALHANIQDAFNEFGVQIMSPHYRSDPASAKVVPKDQWTPPPADARNAPATSGSNHEGPLAIE